MQRKKDLCKEGMVTKERFMQRSYLCINVPAFDDPSTVHSAVFDATGVPFCRIVCRNNAAFSKYVYKGLLYNGVVDNREILLIADLVP